MVMHAFSMIGAQFRQQPLFDRPSVTGGKRQAAQQRISPMPLRPTFERISSTAEQGAFMHQGHVPRAALPDRPEGRSMEEAGFGKIRSGEHTQLPALMTTDEITSRYQALDGDREPQYWGDEDSYSRSSHVNYAYRPDSMYSSSSRPSRQFAPTLPADRAPSIDEHKHESDDELYDRKYEEASGDRWDHNESLLDNILQHGVKNPISLQDPANPSRGSRGLPEVLGGHHRLAVMREHAPDELVPVTYSHHIFDAKREQGRRY